MATLLKQKRISCVVTGENVWPNNPAETIATIETLLYLSVVKDVRGSPLIEVLVLVYFEINITGSIIPYSI